MSNFLIRAFRHSYLAALLFTIGASAQVYTPNNGYFIWGGGRFTQGLTPPRRDTTAIPGKIDTVGSIIYWPADKSLWNKTDTGWTRIAAGGSLGDYYTKTESDARYPLKTLSINTTSPLQGGGNLTAERTLSILDAAADGSTKGAASFTANDFNSTSGNISIDYTNGQTASSSTKGFLTAADWTTFNGKAPATGGTGYIWNGTTAQSANYNINNSARIGGTLGVGTAAIQSVAKVYISTTTLPQIRTEYNSGNRMDITTGSTGSTTFDLAGTSPVFNFSQRLNVNSNMQATHGAYLSVNNTGSLGGGMTLENGTSAGAMLPTFVGIPRFDTNQVRELIGTLLSSSYYGVDTTSKVADWKDAVMSDGGIIMGAVNERDTYFSPRPSDNLFGIIKQVQNTDADAGTKPNRSAYVLRLGGDDNLQMKGKLAVGYPFTDAPGKIDKASRFVKSFPSGLAAMFNGRVSGADGVNDSDYVTSRQYTWANVKSYGATGDGVTDDASAFNAAFASGKPVFVPPGIYLLNSTITMPIVSTIAGVGVASVLKTTSNTPVLSAPNGYCTIMDLQILGSTRGTATPYSTTSANQHGISMNGNNALKNFISNVFFKELGGAGVYSANNIGGSTKHEGNQIVGCKFESCWAGLYADTRGEYNLLSVPIMYSCEYGVYFKAGNNSITGGNVSDNRTGVFISTDSQNDGHCVISGTKINHSVDYSVRAENVQYGYNFDGCIMAVGDIYLNASNGIKFTDCEFALDTIFAQSATKCEITDIKFRTTPTLWLNFNGTNNSGAASDVTFFNPYFWVSTPTTITHNKLRGITEMDSARVLSSKFLVGNNGYLSGSPAGMNVTVHNSGVEAGAGVFSQNKGIYLYSNTTLGIYKLDAFDYGASAVLPITIGSTQNVAIGSLTPTSKLHVGGSFAATNTAISTGVTMGASYIYRVTTSGNTLTLPAASSCNGRIYWIRNEAAATNTISAVLIDGVSTTTVPANTAWQIYSDGTNWRLLSRSN